MSLRDPEALLPWLLVVACAGQAGAGPAALSSVRSPVQAVIGRDHARFVFPAESGTAVRWDVPVPQVDTTWGEFYWTVEWQSVAPRGTVPTDLNLVTYWRPGGPRVGSWAQLIGAWRPTVEVECGDCQESLRIATEDAAVKARFVAGHVVMTVRGAEAIARIFPTVPDSVVLIRSRPEIIEEKITVGVERERP